MNLSRLPWPIEETAECGYCGHVANVTDFMLGEETSDGSECPNCGFVEDSPPLWDEHDIRRNR